MSWIDAQNLDESEGATGEGLKKAEELIALSEEQEEAEPRQTALSKLKAFLLKRRQQQTQQPRQRIKAPIVLDTASKNKGQQLKLYRYKRINGKLVKIGRNPRYTERLRQQGYTDEEINQIYSSKERRQVLKSGGGYSRKPSLRRELQRIARTPIPYATQLKEFQLPQPQIYVEETEYEKQLENANSIVKRRQQLSRINEEIRRRVNEKKRQLGRTMNLMKAHENMNPVKMDFTGVGENNILKAQNVFSTENEQANNIFKKKRINILQTKEAGNDLRW